MLHAYRFRVEFIWGHQSRIIGLSKSNPSFYYPPPTTILGALAEALAKRYGLGENPGTSRELISELSKRLLAIGVKPLNTIPLKYMDINRIIAVKITGEIRCPHPRHLDKSFDAPARGKTIMASIDSDPPTLDIMLVFREDELRIHGRKVVIDRDVLWDIHRLGSRESIVSVIDVKYSDRVESVDGSVVTRYSFPVRNDVRIVGEIRKRWVYEIYIDPFNIDHSKNYIEQYLSGVNTTPFKIPIMVIAKQYPEIKLQVEGSMTAYKVFFNRREEVVVGRKP